MKRVVLLSIFLFFVPVADATIGVWVDQGVVIAPVSTDTPGQPNVLFENSGCVIVTSPCFKMWFSTKNGVAYAESLNGTSWTRYSSNPVIAIPCQPFANLFKNGSTYYLYGNTGTCTAGSAAPPISAYTSADGITWTLQKADIGIGAPAFGQLQIVTISGGTWYGYFTALSANIYSEELATSTDGFNWAAQAANTITQNQINNPRFLNVGGTWYAWGNMVIPGSLTGSCNGCPTEISRFKSVGGNPIGNSPTGPWVQDVPSATFYRTRSEEGVGTGLGQVGDASIAAANGNLYLYYTVNTNGTGNTGYQISCSIASSTALSQLITTYEGIQNIPIPWGSVGPLWQFAPISNENFQRANANPIGGNWSTFTGFSAIQLASNTAEGTATAVNNGAINSLVLPNDQCTQIKMSTIAGTTSFAGVIMRSSGVAATAYFAYYSTGAQHFIQKDIAGTFTTIVSGGLATPAASGDVITGCAIGNIISMYVNGNLLDDGVDNAIASGASGFFFSPATAVTNAATNNWFGGGVQNSPTIYPVGKVVSP